jgi:hypothetical protein
VRIFAPIIFDRDQSPGKKDWVLVDDKPCVHSPLPSDKRTVYEQSLKGRVDKPGEIIGIVEAGFSHPKNWITQKTAADLVSLMSQNAPDLRRASLEQVLETIAESTKATFGADAAAFGYLHNKGERRFVFQATAGDLSLIEWERIWRLGGQSRIAEVAIFRPKEAVVPVRLEHQPTDYQGSFGLGTEITPTFGALYIAFHGDRSLSQFDQNSLEYLAYRGQEAFRMATYITRLRTNAGRLRNLQRIASVLAELPQSADLLNGIAGYARNMFAADVVIVHEYDRGQSAFLAEIGMNGRLKFPELTVDVRQEELSAPFLLLGGKKNLYEEDSHFSTIFCPRGRETTTFVHRESIVSTAGIILRTRSEDVGVMFLNYRSHHRFFAEERDMIETLASTAAIAIRSRRSIVRSR